MKKIIKNVGAFFILGVILIPAVVFSMDSQSTGWKVFNGSNKDIIIPGGSCQEITNNSGKDIFVPTKTMPEWTAFRNNLPSGVTVGACAAVPPPPPPPSPPPPPKTCTNVGIFKTYANMGKYLLALAGKKDYAACLASHPGCPNSAEPVEGCSPTTSPPPVIILHYKCCSK